MPQAAGDDHAVRLEEVDDEYFVSIDHPMTKDHYLSFAAWVSYDRMTLIRLYPEQAAELRLPAQRRGELYLYCTEHGLLRRQK